MTLLRMLYGALIGGLLSGALLAAEDDNIFGIALPQSLEDLEAIAHEDAEAGFTFRKWYGAYFFQGLQRYEDPGLGYSLGYATTNGTYISVYVYDLGLRDIEDGLQSPPVLQELASASRALGTSGRYARVEEVQATTALSPHFVQASQLLTLPQGGQIKSHTLVRGQNGYFIKLRITGTSGALEARVAQFLEYLVRDLGVDTEP